jgi:hypothetical protein
MYFPTAAIFTAITLIASGAAAVAVEKDKISPPLPLILATQADVESQLARIEAHHQENHPIEARQLAPVHVTVCNHWDWGSPCSIIAESGGYQQTTCHSEFPFDWRSRL